MSTAKSRQLPQPIDLQGQYIFLKTLKSSIHAADLWEVLQGQNVVWKYLMNGPYADEKSFFNWVSDCENHKSRIYFAVIDLSSGKALGLLSLMDYNSEHGTVEVGGIVFSPKLQKTRMASEAIYLLGNYVFDELGYRRFQWKCNNENQASKKAAERFGFVFEGVFRQHMILKGENRDTAYFSIVDGEWELCKSGFKKWLEMSNFDERGQQKSKLMIR